MNANGRTFGGSAAPPRELNVAKFIEARAPELASLHSIVANRLNKDFRVQRNKRRRTTGHDDRNGNKRKRVKVVEGNSQSGDLEGKGEKKLPRRIRRRIELKKNPQSGFVTSGDGTKRLRTHVWHAKRFTMEKLWGFYIPLGLHGRGRGSRDILKKLKNSVLLHDMSYCSCVQLEGPEETLITLLSSLLAPPPSEFCEEISREVLSGSAFGTYMLHDAKKPYHCPICPVSLMWRPMHKVTTDAEPQSIIIPDVGSCNSESDVRQVWVWIHAWAFEQAYNTLLFACKTLTGTPHTVSCVSLEGQLAKLEFAGSKVFPLLQKTLVRAGCVDSWHLKKCSGENHKDESSANQISASSIIIPLIVKDPRTLNKNEVVIASEEKPFGELRIEGGTIASVLGDKAAVEHIDLWDVSKGLLCPPVEDSILSLEKHNQRKEHLCLFNESSELKADPAAYSGVCPVLLLVNAYHEESVSRCSVILPLGWVKTFWNAFISGGAHAVGLRERHWVATELGLPFFPWDFPDCSAYSNLMAKEAAELDHKASLLSASKRPPEIPVPPPWNCVRLSLETTRTEQCSLQNEATKEAIANSTLPEIRNSLFEGIVLRTSSVLCAENMLLFPKLQDPKSNSLYDSMKNKYFPEQAKIATPEQQSGEECHYLRVILHAYKEGSFEQGAVICAPQVSDITLVTKREDKEDQQLQDSHSYFMKLQTGEWKLRVSNDPACLKSHRWPIGFVTSGFVRGSKKVTAIALCESKLLSNLRKEQWSALPVRRRRKEVFVLVRNLRSTAYRLALATIVLEHKEQDLECF